MANLFEVAPETIQQMSQDGVFFCTQAQGKSNIMTMGWGGFNYYWRKPLFVAPVRYPRFSHELLEANGQFALCVPTVPFSAEMKKALAFCGTKSGRDVDKWATCQLTPQAAREIDVPVIAGSGIIVECKVVYKQDLDMDTMSDEVRAMYRQDGTHTLYYGEIVACYKG